MIKRRVRDFLHRTFFLFIKSERVCVCVCVREKQKETETERDARSKITNKISLGLWFVLWRDEKTLHFSRVPSFDLHVINVNFHAVNPTHCTCKGKLLQVDLIDHFLRRHFNRRIIAQSVDSRS